MSRDPRHEPQPGDRLRLLVQRAGLQQAGWVEVVSVQGGPRRDERQVSWRRADGTAETRSLKGWRTWARGADVLPTQAELDRQTRLRAEEEAYAAAMQRALEERQAWAQRLAEAQREREITRNLCSHSPPPPPPPPKPAPVVHQPVLMIGGHRFGLLQLALIAGVLGAIDVIDEAAEAHEDAP